MINYCTYFDSNYLTRGVALYLSLKRHSPPFVLWVLCFDDQTHEALTKVNQPDLRPIRLDDFEAGDDLLVAAKRERSRIEYYFTCTPSVAWYVLRQDPSIDSITYLDSDLLFYADPTTILASGGGRSITIVPHGFPEHLRSLEIYGVYNVGLVSFRNDDVGRPHLESWRLQCIEWCFDRVEDGKYADQRYLDDWPTYPGVAVIDHPGAGLAPWNVAVRRVQVAGEGLSVNGQPLIFYHFAAFEYLGRGIFDLGLRQYGRIPPQLRRRLYGEYVRVVGGARAWLAERDAAPRVGASIRGDQAFDARRLISDLWRGWAIFDRRTSGF